MLPIVVVKAVNCALGDVDFATGSAIVGTGSPTAVNLTNIQGDSQRTMPILLLAFAAAALLSIVVVVKHSHNRI